MNGTGTTCSCAMATRCFAHTSSTTVATRRWGPLGATSTSRRSAVRRLGRTRRRVTPRPRRTSGGTGTTTTTPRPRLTGSGSRCPTLEKPPSENATQRRSLLFAVRDARAGAGWHAAVRDLLPRHGGQSSQRAVRKRGRRVARHEHGGTRVIEITLHRAALHDTGHEVALRRRAAED